MDIYNIHLIDYRSYNWEETSSLYQKTYKNIDDAWNEIKYLALEFVKKIDELNKSNDPTYPFHFHGLSLKENNSDEWISEDELKKIVKSIVKEINYDHNKRIELIDYNWNTYQYILYLSKLI